MQKSWLNPRDRKKENRLIYIKRLQAHTPTTCPECGNELTIDNEQIYCQCCGLVTQDSIQYQAGFHFKYPHGLRLG